MTQEALRMAHKALIGLSIKHGEMTDEGMDAITNIKEALAKEKALQALHSENERLGLYKDAYAQPEQEPVVVVCCQQYDTCLKPCTPRGRHLAQRTWVGLTDDEIDEWTPEIHTVIKAIEAKLKEKNT